MIQGLYTLVLIEAVLGGGGRVFPVGPVTLRMLLFVACLTVWLVASMDRKRPDGQGLAFLLVFFFIVSILPGLLVDATTGASISRIVAVIQPLLFWLTAPFVAMAIYHPVMVERAAQTIMYGGLFVACAVLAIMGALAVGLLPFNQFYIWASKSGEIFFRSDFNLFFKGHFYIGMALVFTVVLKPRLWRLMSAILAVAIVASLTRGIMLAAMLAILFALVSARRHRALLLLVLIGVVVAEFYGQDIIAGLLGDTSRENSLLVRQADLQSFLESFDAVTIFLGDGAGTLLNDRQNVENSFLWAVWRFGIAGLGFMLFPFLISLYYYRKIGKHDGFRKLASAYFFGMVMMYILTITNPFINNSIGISYALLAIFSLRQLSRAQVEAADISTFAVVR